MLQITFRYRVKKLTNFEGDFDRNLAPTWAPTWPQLGAKLASKRRPKLSRKSIFRATLPGLPKIQKATPKSIKNYPRRSQHRLQKNSERRETHTHTEHEKHTNNECEKHQQTKRKPSNKQTQARKLACRFSLWGPAVTPALRAQ